ncbi:phosphatase PAP2 family protein [Parabacteroides hominis]|jgi:membrane-associated phospholipid phosphatase|uniref:Phosphatidic acid phosphatase type 2/haloperoxidase domain-containing protein n=1 Tax=Parabacteroides hominis TaxID=2763057 RepID=A0ABR7DN23_9BACT|nr:phosphatase PAP2 family protein [Parabacteroides hominis]MBC5632805.1 hypothetical protein [Parabacteroides hominis]MBD9166194.1 hypothetical protein [Parabacteroides johnsonii]
MRLFSNIISGMFHPLLMVTYGVVLALTFTYLAIYPPAMKLLLAGGAFLSTAVIPGAFILMMVKNGAAVDMELSDRHERVVPYLIFITSIMVCAFYMYKMMLPFWFISLLLGACVALILALLINFFWKISAHAIGIGGLLGGIMGVARIHLINPYWAFIIVIIIAGLVGTSRIFLKRHTPMQVYAGFCLGFICTFVASFLSYIYLFI